jgi:hypothetical protein
MLDAAPDGSPGRLTCEVRAEVIDYLAGVVGDAVDEGGFAPS